MIEGTQGFGLSVLHGGYYPKATSRDTTAAAFVSEAGLSPLDVDQVVMVIRSFPIRVAGNSGPLPNEITWEELAKSAGLPKQYCERTTVTQKVRRVGKFDAQIVRNAIAHNNPNQIVLNHLDYIDASAHSEHYSEDVLRFVERVEREIGRPVTWIGAAPDLLERRDDLPSPKIAGSSSRKQCQSEQPTRLQASA